MSLRPFSYLIANPTVTATSGAIVVVGLPVLQALTESASPVVLSTLNLAAFALNVYSVSVPGRLDGAQDEAMRKGDLNPKNEATTKKNNGNSVYLRARKFSLVTPSGWAFSIWAPIYLGEAILCAAQFIPAAKIDLQNITAPFVAANVLQSLWCVSFRAQSVNGSWTSLVSPAMLAGTAYSLSKIAFPQYISFLSPVTLHFGWVTAATLVNLNSSLIAMVKDDTKASKIAAAVGHGSAVLAAAIGVGLTLTQSLPIYGATLAWALTACAHGISKDERRVAKIQTGLCAVGAGACAAATAYVLFRK